MHHETPKQEQERQLNWQHALWALAAVLILYIGLAFLVMRAKHPWMTETELIQYSGAAMLFKEVPHTDNGKNSEPKD
jgi:hypothetical protein